jgi:hypothetical protein
MATSARRIAAVASTLLLVSLGSGGCGQNKLETGYAYTPLGQSTSTQRRAYFANPFSPEARAAQMESATEGYDRSNRSGR